MHRQPSMALCSALESVTRIRIVSGLSCSTASSGPSASASRGTVDVARSPVREVRNVFRKIRYMPETWSLPEKKKILSRPSRKFPAPGPLPLHDSASANRGVVELVEERHRQFFERIGLRTRP